MHPRFKLLAVVFAIFAILAMASPSFAVRANDRKVFTFTQPDGKTTFRGILKGDEHFGFAEDEDGFSIICRSDGWWTYAKHQDGLLVPTKDKSALVTLLTKEHLRPNADAIAALPQEQGQDDQHLRPSTGMNLPGVFFTEKAGTKEKPTLYSIAKAIGPRGKRYINILLGDFTDSTFSYFSNKVNPPAWPAMPKDTYRHLLTVALGDRDSAKPIIYDSTSSPSLTNFYWDMSMQKMYFASDYSVPNKALGVDTIRMSAIPSQRQLQGRKYDGAVAANADPHVNFRDPITGLDNHRGRHSSRPLRDRIRAHRRHLVVQLFRL